MSRTTWQQILYKMHKPQKLKAKPLTILTAASKMAPSHVMIMNIVLTAIGVLLGLFVNARYAKMVSLAESDE